MGDMSGQPSTYVLKKDRHVFLSYSSKDHDLAQEFKTVLEALDVNVWIDTDRIQPGALFINELEKAIEKACAFVVLVTSDSLSSGWVREECGRAITLSIQSAFRLPVIPIAVKGAEIPGFLSNRAALQLPDKSHLPSVAGKIAEALSINVISEKKNQHRTMIRWHSRSKDYKSGDVSLLSIAETIVAMVLTIAISTLSGSLTYLAVLSLIAPLALLQSDKSRAIGIRWLKRLEWWKRFRLDNKNDSRIANLIRKTTLVLIFLGVVADFSKIYPPINSFTLKLSFVIILLILLGITPPLLVRFSATLFIAIRHPIITLKSMPANWKNLILSKDLLE